MTKLDRFQSRTGKISWIAPLLLACFSIALNAQLVPFGSTWKYLDDGSDQGTAWVAPSYNDSSWDAGPAQLGYGGNGEVTTIGFGGNSSNKYITTYFRHTFDIADPSALGAIDLSVVRDDGIVVYLNGTQIFSANMPASFSYTTVSSSAISGADEFTPIPGGTVPANLFVTGQNTIAVEIHQQSPTSSDLSFDLELAEQTPGIDRGPYLQLTSDDQVTVRWRTTIPTDTQLSYGPSLANLDTTVTDPALTTEHSVTLTGLAPDTTYYYNAGSTTVTYATGPNLHFTTHPPVGTDTPTRIWVLGDPGTANADQRAVRDAFENFNGGASADVVLMLGDNAYDNGTDTEFQNAVFDIYPDTMSTSAVWPTFGNHDAGSASSVTQSGVYYDIFTLPTNAEAGGVPSGTEAYYSFDYGQVHFVCLDSHDTPRTTTGAMATWLEADLAATTQEFVIVFWHHPPYSKGGHNSDSSTASGGRLKDMREIFVPILESYGVDLVLSGHSHTYQRSYLLDGHHDTSDTLDPGTMILDAGDGDLAGDGAYLKQPVPHDGAVYTVAGSSGKVDSASFTPHPVMHTTLLELGSMIIDVSGNQMDVTFLNDSGSVSDSFAIVHGTEQPEGVPETLIPFDDTWAYLDDGSNQGSGQGAAWQLTSFDDSSWATGPAQLGYGGNGEDTTIGYGGNSSNKYITTYFRKSFDLADPSSISGLTVDVVRDDGAIVYLNGTEIFRTNMPAGTASYTTTASAAVGGSDETAPFSTSVDPALLVAGTNTIAVEIHQANATSSDLSFNLRLREAFPSLTREPYLQLASEDGVTIRWKTNLPTDSVVFYGTDPASLDYYTSVTGPTADHSVKLTGLTADTTYYYSVGSSADTFATGSDYFFKTHPPIGSQAPTRIWVLGDSGTADANAAAVRDAYTAYNGSPSADVLLMLGDNAYNTGTASEYQAAVFDMYPETLRNTPLWSTLGNHDAGSATSSNQSGVYYDIFDLPTNAEAGGVASGTEAYYSFDHANVHFVCLNSQDVDRTGTGAMANWLVNDLAATTQEFIIAFWHHPPYSKGSHNSDSEARLVEMRQVFVPILESYGVDLVLGGHSHSYERSMLIDGHTGTSSTFNIGTMAKDSGDGDPAGDGAYTKEAAPNDGAVYAVAGSSGKITNAPLDHPVMLSNHVALGSMVIDVNGTQMDVNFIDSTGSVLDTFAIHHQSSQPNTAPALTQNSLTVDEGATVLITASELAATDAESDPANLVFTVSSVTSGTFQLNGSDTTSFTGSNIASGQITFVHDGSEFAPTYDVVVSDGALDSGAPATATIAYTAVNDAPVADAQSAGTAEDTPSATITLTSSDAENDPLTFAIDSAPTNGTLSGTLPDLVYTPAQDFFGVDSFTFTTNDGALTSAPATVTLTVSPVNDPPVANAHAITTTEDSPSSTFSLTGSDPEGDPLNFSIATQPSNGTLSGILPDLTYTPAQDFFGQDSFTFTADDGDLTSIAATVTIDVAPVNDPPVANAQSVNTLEDTTSGTITLTGFDAEGAPLGFATVSTPANGTLSGSPPSLTYTPEADFHGTDSFQFTVNDGDLTSAPAAVTITVDPVNDPPAALADSATLPEDTTIDIFAPGLLSNDSDPDDDPLIVNTTPVTSPQHGTLTLNADGSYSYTHDGSETTSDSFTYQVDDGNNGSAQATVAITITPVNDPPQPAADSATLAEGATLNVPALGLLANDSDPEDDALTVNTSPVTGPAYGELTLNADGSYVYTHDGSESTSDAFVYEVTDGTDTAQATVTLTVTPVNDPPVALADTASVAQGDLLTVPAPGLLTNDSDPENDDLTVSLLPVTPPSHGTLTLAADGSYSYDHNGSETTTDSFTYEISDGSETAQATVTITITEVNDPPVANPDTGTVDEGATLTAAAPGLLANDTDPESDPLTVATGPVTGPLYGTLILNPDGSYAYTHNGSETVTDSFVYAISDGKGGNAQATTTITINPVNDAPVADAQSLTTDEDTAITPLTLTASDAENSPLTFAVTTQPTNGTLSGTAPALTYTPDPDFFGADSFEFSAGDGDLSSAATVSITVNAVNDPPVASPQSLATAEDTATGVITLAATDADSDPLTFAITSPPTNGSLSGTAPAVTYTPNQDFHGTDSFAFSANDGTESSIATVTITVDPVNDPPVATADTATVAEGETLTAPAGTLLANDSDPDDDLTVNTAPVAGPANGTLTLGNDGSFTYTHDDSETTSDSFIYQIDDGNGATAQATVAITVTPVRDPVITRAPYLQALTSTSVIVRWSTDEETDSVVRYGTSSASLTSTATGTGSGSDHTVTLTGLAAETTYFYSVGDSVDAIATSPDYYVTTYADPGTASATRLWVLGDSGTSPSSATAVRDAFLTYNSGAHADALILLGNNVTPPADTDAYQSSLFDLLPATLGNSPAWPTIGTNEATDTATYLDTFDQPAYYSFDHANIHVVCLDTTAADLTATGQMATWLQTDLANNLQEWVIVFFHHPPYSKGLHDSDAPGSVLESVRTNILPILEANGADLVLSAHSHSYERSALLDGHYGDSTTFNPAMAIDAGNGDPAGTGGYVKQPVANAGTVYAVVGSSGAVDSGSGSLNHPAMVRNLAELGSLVIDISGNQLDANFVDSAGTVRDTFQIRHETPVADVEIIIDNNDPEVSVNGRMESSTSNPGYYGDDYLHDRNRKKGNVYATFTPDITTPGTYSVSARWPADTSHSDAVPVNIVHADGSELVSVDQTTNGDQWVLLGIYDFDIGTAGSVTIHAKDPVTGQKTSGFVIADAVRFTLEAPTGPDTTPPAPPANLGTAAGDSTVAIVWDANSESDLASYTVYRSTTSGSGYLPIASSLTGTSHIDDSVVNDTTYYYVATATDTAGNESGYSNESSATPTFTPDTTPPAAPSNLNATAGDGTVSLTWNANSEPDLSLYTVKRSISSSGPYTTVATSSSPGYTDNAVTNDTTYFYVVTATDTNDNQSSNSTPASATPTAPTTTTVHIGALAITVYKDGGKHYRADVTATVLDSEGEPVQGATVSGDWTYKGSANGSGSGTTDAFGQVTLTSDRERANAGDVFGFTVTGITGTDLVYDAAQNVATTVSAPRN